ncbi:MAG: amidohydrolase [Chloroflexi bacterium]|nr:amidohydrolase [Chloroflexota bacterium]
MVRAIDMHVHAPLEPGTEEPYTYRSIKGFFRPRTMPSNPEEMAALYQELDILGVILTIDTETVTGQRPSSNDWIASIVQRWPHQFVGFASVDPWKGKQAVQELERCVKELGLRGLKVHPVEGKFELNDPRFYPLWEKCAELRVPLLFHSGFAASGAGQPGGDGYKLKYSAPIPYVDDVAADFPELTIIMAHPAWPWVEEQIAVVLHKANVFMDFSGWSPRFIPKALVQEANTRLKDKVLFGSDYPFLPPDRWLKEFEQMDMREEVRPRFLKENAKRALGLDVD